MTAFRNHRFSESFQRFSVSYIADKPVAGLLVNDMDSCAFTNKCIRDGFADSMGSAGHNRNLPFKHHSRPSGSFPWFSRIPVHLHSAGSVSDPALRDNFSEFLSSHQYSIGTQTFQSDSAKPGH